MKENENLYVIEPSALNTVLGLVNEMGKPTLAAIIHKALTDGIKGHIPRAAQTETNNEPQTVE